MSDPRDTGVFCGVDVGKSDRVGLPPTRSVGDVTAGWMREIWDRGTMVPALSIEGGIATYSFYDHIAFGIARSSGASGQDGGRLHLDPDLGDVEDVDTDQREWGRGPAHLPADVGDRGIELLGHVG